LPVVASARVAFLHSAANRLSAKRLSCHEHHRISYSNAALIYKPHYAFCSSVCPPVCLLSRTGSWLKHNKG